METNEKKIVTEKVNEITWEANSGSIESGSSFLSPHVVNKITTSNNMVDLKIVDILIFYI